MEISDLKPADILLFSGEKGSWISEAIMFLTDSSVSHAAMTYTSSEKIVEESPPAVQVNDAAQRFKGRTVYVMRIDPSKDSMSPVLDASEGYLNKDEPYAMSNLYLVGLLLLYRKFTPSTQVQKVMLKIFKKLAADIIKYINKHKNPGKLPMVCSQFVYQCYDDAGTGYKLKIKDGILLHAAVRVAGERNVIDQAIYRIKSDISYEFRSFVAANAGIALRDEEPQSKEELARELVEVLKTQEVAKTEALDQRLVLAIQEFGQAVYAATTGVSIDGADMLRCNALKISPSGLSFLKSEEAYFVAPADLLSHCVNVEQIGIIKVA